MEKTANVWISSLTDTLNVSDARWTLIQNEIDPIQQTLISIAISILLRVFCSHFSRLWCILKWLDWFIKESVIFATINMNGIWVECFTALGTWMIPTSIQFQQTILNHCNVCVCMCIYSYAHSWNALSEINRNDINRIAWKQIKSASTILNACSTFRNWSNGPEGNMKSIHSWKRQDSWIEKLIPCKWF